MKKQLHHILEGIGLLFISLAIALVFRLFFADFYKVPSDSMQPAIEPGDFIAVNKLYFGARFYKNFDFLGGTPPETFRTPGYSSLKHNDVVVFNYPKRQNGKWEMDLTIFYVKRCIGLPGDTLTIHQGIYHVNGKSGYGNLVDQKVLHRHRGSYSPGIYHTYPFDNRKWNIQEFGPLYLPKKGDTLPMDSVNAPLYRHLVAYETRHSAHVRNKQLYVGDSLVLRYTFRQNWYFMAGDKVFNSRDSRYLGPIPEDFIVGKVAFVLSSKDPVTNEYNWDRFFKRIH